MGETIEGEKVDQGMGETTGGAEGTDARGFFHPRRHAATHIRTSNQTICGSLRNLRPTPVAFRSWVLWFL